MQANYKEDSRIVLTLDAGGTKFAFSAMAAGDQIVEATETPSHADNLDLCLRTIVTGFAHVMSQLLEKPSASERIQAVNVLKTEEADHRVTDALLQTLNFDETINVRVKAAQALAHFGHEDPNIKIALLNSLKNQKSPEVQIALIDVLVTLEETRAVPSLQKMSQDKRLIDIVRQKAATGANMLLYEL